jgi:Zn finger protein HypA/HybF involved in hydrogenase expression
MPYKTTYEDSIIECPSCKSSAEYEVPKKWEKDLTGIERTIIQCWKCNEPIKVEKWQFEKL